MAVRFIFLCLMLATGSRGVAQIVDAYQVPQAPIDLTDLPDNDLKNPEKQTLSATAHHFYPSCDEKLPVFIGGKDSLRAFLNRHVQWPDSLPQSVRGTVFIRFTIDERGDIRNARIVQSLHPLADAEALRLAGLLSGHFTPGSRDGRAAAVGITLPLAFRGTDAAPLPEDGLTDIVTFETYRAIGHGGPVMICEELPTYRARNRKDNLGLFIQQNLRWPHTREDVEGRIHVSFIVGPDGQVYRAKVLNKLHPLFDAEALRVVQLLSGHLTPAACGGKDRPHEMVVPVTFRMQ
ncbi:energy transducer TonB [Hymenobacter sp. NST-14]|uniref:TonB family protein n=1 Tax=Hymenobacter piscis TaxID=2839984 RepID=UPI001C012461|nr:TonB family protein [Hymenobacter piscis]MBT9392022.1 energy transducer TonB [Hymenobacter piscis]